MNLNERIDELFSDLGADVTIWRTDNDANHRIGSVAYTESWGVRSYAMVFISDHRQGRGESVTIGESDGTDLDVRVTSKRQRFDFEHVHMDDLHTVVIEALDALY